MAYFKRRRLKGRRGLNRTRRMRRRGLTRVRRSKQTKVFYVKRNVLKTAITQTTITDGLGGFYFTLQDVPNYTDFTNLYDSYKICRIKVRFIPQYNVQALSVPGSVVEPKMFTVVDTNDVATPASLNALREDSRVKVTRGQREHKRYFKPMIAQSAYNANFTSSYAMASPWLSTASYDVQYYGIKYGTDAGASGQTSLQKWDVECTYYMKFSHPK